MNKADKRTIKQIAISVLIMFTIALLTTWLLTGCTASYHMNKALKKDPSILVADTVNYTDTVWQIVAKVDTVVRLRKEYDTIKYIQDSVVVELVRLPGDSIWIAADCPDCPEITKTNTITNTITIHDTFWKGLKRFWWLILVGPAIILFIKLKP